VKAETANTSTGNAVEMHAVNGYKSDSEDAALQQVAAELSGSVIGQPPNVSIQFVLGLQNNGPQEIKIADPLDSLLLQFTTIGNKLITLPMRVPKALIDTKPLEYPTATSGGSKRVPYPAPIEFRQTVSATGINKKKEEIITVPPGGKVQIVFDCEPVVMETVVTALRSEMGESAKSFKARATLALISAPPQIRGHSLDSDWIFFTIPSL
jgi:hypothetical protein